MNTKRSNQCETRKLISLHNIDAKSAFQKVDVDPDWAAVFTYRLDGLIFVYL